MIRDVIRDAEVAWYPIKIIIGDFTALDGLLNIANNANNGGTGIDQILVEYRSEILALVDASRYINREKIWASIQEKEHGPATAFLLTLLPDLRSIEFHNLSMSGAAVLSVVRKIVSESKRDPKRPHPLSKLAFVSLEGLIDDFESLANLAVFVEVRSLRSIRCQYVQGNIKTVREKAESWIKIPEPLSDIISLGFSKSALEQSDLMPLFDSIKALQTYIYEYARPEENGQVEDEEDEGEDGDEDEDGDEARITGAGKWEPRKIVQSLLARFSNSLVTLDLTTADTEIRHGSLNAGQIFVGDLRSFRVLKELRTDTLLFIESSLEKYIAKAIKEEFEAARQTKIRKGNHHFALSAKEHLDLVDRHTHPAINTDDRVHRLEGLLPESLEKLTLCVALSGASSTIQPMFRGLPGRLGNLKKMTFEAGNPLKPATEAALARAGVLVL